VSKRYALLDAQWERIKDLLADRAVSQQDHDDADAALKQVDAEIASAAGLPIQCSFKSAYVFPSGSLVFIA
jgi:multidrug resistance efflux pump